MAERVVLVAIGRKISGRRFLNEQAEEMKELVRSANGSLVVEMTVMIDRPSPSHYIHRGKVAELGVMCRAKRADLAIFSVDLSPVQARNLESACGTRIVDRTGLILDIFARRAQSREGRLQVELAQLNYLLPRLVGKGVLLSRLGGGIGTRGPGEQKLEVDRRQIRNRIARIKGELEKVIRHRELLRQSRKRKDFQVVAIVGYTNAGKSSLLNALTGSNAFVEDKLFATLDPTTRVFVTKNSKKILLTDTVGFLQNLPHHLIEAFKATLEEVREADALVHVMDVADPFVEEHFRVVNQLLADLDALHKPTVVALNKIDLLTLDDRKRMEEKFPGGVLVSVKERLNFSQLAVHLDCILNHDMHKTLNSELEHAESSDCIID